MPTGVLIALVVVAAILCVVMITVMYMDNKGLIGSGKEDQQDEAETEGSNDEISDHERIENLIRNMDLHTVTEKEKTDHTNVDLQKLKDTVNPEIYAWLYVPDTGIDYPVVRRYGDDLFYTNHNSEGAEDPDGAIFTQYFNTGAFDDNVTVIYGSNNENGKMFSNLKAYGDPSFLASHPYIYIYIEDKIFVYRVFAAYESDDTHILNILTPHVEDHYKDYITGLEDRMGLDANTDKDAWPTYTDKILTLSTHVTGKPDRRYLVQAILYGITEQLEDE